MADIVIGERWNTEDSLEMSLGIRKAIDSVIRKEEPTSECSRLLKEGISFLDEAKGGGALISGVTEDASSFNGTFLPLCLATDVWISVKEEASDESNDYTKVGSLLSSYKSVLEEIEEKGSMADVEERTLREVAGFFEVLFRLVLQQGDPMTKQYSQAYI